MMGWPFLHPDFLRWTVEMYFKKKKGLLKGLPIPEGLFDKVTADVFELGQIQEECLYTRKPIDGVLLIQDRHSGYIQVFPCN